MFMYFHWSMKITLHSRETHPPAKFERCYFPIKLLIMRPTEDLLVYLFVDSVSCVFIWKKKENVGILREEGNDEFNGDVVCSIVLMFLGICYSQV
jgi:hypothetical protein